MAALLGENSVQYNSTTPHASGTALMVTTCRPTSCASSHIWVLLRCFPWPPLIFSKSPKVMGAITPVHQGWIDIERPFAALALSVPEAADVLASYTIRRLTVGNGRKFLLWVAGQCRAVPACRNLSPRWRGWPLRRSDRGNGSERRLARRT